jgi:type VI protein secretion system component Hcp
LGQADFSGPDAEGVPIYSFSLEITSESDSVPGGSTTARTVWSNIGIERDADRYSPDFFLAACEGRSFRDANFYLRKPRSPYRLNFRLDNYSIAGIETNTRAATHPSADPSKIPEDIQLRFDSIVLELEELVRGDGSHPGDWSWIGEVGFDLSSNTYNSSSSELVQARGFLDDPTLYPHALSLGQEGDFLFSTIAYEVYREISHTGPGGGTGRPTVVPATIGKGIDSVTLRLLTALFSASAIEPFELNLGTDVQVVLNNAVVSSVKFESAGTEITESLTLEPEIIHWNYETEDASWDIVRNQPGP